MSATTLNAHPLAQARRARGLSQLGLATAAGVGRSTIASLEIGQRPAPETRTAIVRVLRIDPWSDQEAER